LNFLLIEIKKLTTEISLTSEELQMLLHKYVSNTNGNTSSLHQQQRMENGLRPNSTYNFVGTKSRTKSQLQSLMYCEEMEHWLAEERLEEARSQARLVAALLHQDREQEQSTTHDAGDTIGQTVQVVDDEDEVTTIRRPILPDITA